jgi:capsule polysaccharide export protein KpsE/RkpR
VIGRLWSERRFVGRAIYLGLLLSTVIAFWITPKYESNTQIMPPDKQNLASLAAVVGSSDDKLSALAADAVGMKSSGALFVGILRSRTVQDRLVTRFGLQEVYGVSLMASAREVLVSNTDIAEDRKSGIISLTVTDASPERARNMATAYVEELNRLSAEVSTSAARREREFLQARLTAVKAELTRSARDLSEFSARNVTFDPKEQGKAGFEAISRIQGELIATQAQLSGMEQIYSPQNVRVRALRAKIGELRRQLNAFASGPEDGGGQASAYPSLSDLPALGVTYYGLYRDVRVQEAVLEVLTKQFELAKVQEAKEIPTVRVLDEANVPETKSHPRRLSLIVLGSGLAAILAIVILLVSDAWRFVDTDHPLKVVFRESEKSISGAIHAGSRRWGRIFKRPARPQPTQF